MNFQRRHDARRADSSGLAYPGWGSPPSDAARSCSGQPNDTELGRRDDALASERGAARPATVLSRLQLMPIAELDEHQLGRTGLLGRLLPGENQEPARGRSARSEVVLGRTNPKFSQHLRLRDR